MAKKKNLSEPVKNLTSFFITNYPKEAARKIELMSIKTSTSLLAKQSTKSLLELWLYLSPSIADEILLQLPQKSVIDLLSSMNINYSIAILSRLPRKKTEIFVSLLDPELISEFREILSYPNNSTGRIMNVKVIEFHRDTLVKDTLALLQKQKPAHLSQIFIFDDDMRLCGSVDVRKLIISDENDTLLSIAKKVDVFAHPLDPKNELIEKFNKYHVESIPVIDENGCLIGIVYGSSLLAELKENIITEMQTMVGASKDERATSSGLFAIKKRMPWLQINLLTAFLASAVVGLFQDIISSHTALAVLMPIAAGQAGNTGAQSLAVTMRGLALREITTRDWFKMVTKEFYTGFVNGISIALTCSISVYLWSFNIGLSVVIAIAMILSMTLAGITGALVPIILKKLGFDPAQSSSIVLTTFTDICGFTSFLGVAVLLADYI